MVAASEHAQALTDIFTQDLHLSTVEIDEFWSFVRKKTAGRTAQMQANDGDASCKTAPAASSLPVPAVRIGEDLVERAVTLTVTRTLGRPVDWCSDGWRGYKAILTRAYRQPVHTGRPGRPSLQVSPDVRLTQTIKHRDEHGKLLSIEIRAALGEVIPEPATVQHSAGQWCPARSTQCPDPQDPCVCQTGRHLGCLGLLATV